MTFAMPYLLFSLLVVPLAAVGYRILEGRRARRSAAWAKPAMLPNIVRRPSQRLGRLPGVLFLLGLTFLLVGFARPQRVLDGADGAAPTVVLTFDVSGSMAADDVHPTRIRLARSVAIQFLHELPSTYRVAVVTFGGKARLLVPPTFDRERVLAGLPTAVTPRSATAIGDAVSASVAVIGTASGHDQPGGLSRPGAVLLLSDGSQTAAGTTPAEAAVAAVADYVPVDTIAVGTGAGTVTQRSNTGRRQTSTQIAVPVQPITLRALSRQTGGLFFEAASVARTPSALSGVYEGLRSHTSPTGRTHELSTAAAAVALGFILAGVVLSGLWFGQVA
jgi:Ca-activated chloride channel homolog